MQDNAGGQATAPTVPSDVDPVIRAVASNRAKAKYEDRPLQFRATPALRKQIDALVKTTGLTESQLLRYAASRLPDARTMTGDDIADLVVHVIGKLPGEIAG